MPLRRNSRRAVVSDADRKPTDGSASDVEEVSGPTEDSDSVIEAESSDSPMQMKESGRDDEGDDDGGAGSDDDDDDDDDAGSSQPGSPSLVLPLRFGQDLEVLALGSLKKDGRFFHSTNCLYPTDYVARKIHTSYKNPSVDTWYYCSIVDKGNRPVFLVHAADDAVGAPRRRCLLCATSCC